jgi:hypothetical protein
MARIFSNALCHSCESRNPFCFGLVGSRLRGNDSKNGYGPITWHSEPCPERSRRSCEKSLFGFDTNYTNFLESTITLNLFQGLMLCDGMPKRVRHDAGCLLVISNECEKSMGSWDFSIVPLAIGTHVEMTICLFCHLERSREIFYGLTRMARIFTNALCHSCESRNLFLLGRWIPACAGMTRWPLFIE